MSPGYNLLQGNIASFPFFFFFFFLFFFFFFIKFEMQLEIPKSLSFTSSLIIHNRLRIKDKTAYYRGLTNGEASSKAKNIYFTIGFSQGV